MCERVCENVVVSVWSGPRQTQKPVCVCVCVNLVFLPALPLLLDLLLLLQLLGDARLPKGLALAALVGLGVQGRLQGRVPPHAHHHFLTQLGGHAAEESAP